MPGVFTVQPAMIEASTEPVVSEDDGGILVGNGRVTPHGKQRETAATALIVNLEELREEGG